MTITQKLKEKIRELYNQRVSKSEIAIRLKVSRPVVIEACKEVDKMKKAIPTEIDSQKEGVIAAKAFTLFRAGKKPDEVVIELKQPPEVILKLYKQWTAITHLYSELMYEFMGCLSAMGCQNCGEYVQPTSVVVGYCNGCKNTTFFGSNDELARMPDNLIYVGNIIFVENKQAT